MPLISYWTEDCYPHGTKLAQFTVPPVRRKHTQTPHVDGRSVGQAKDHLRRPVEPGLNVRIHPLMGVARAAEIDDLDARRTPRLEQDVLLEWDQTPVTFRDEPRRGELMRFSAASSPLTNWFSQPWQARRRNRSLMVGEVSEGASLLLRQKVQTPTAIPFRKAKVVLFFLDIYLFSMGLELNCLTKMI